MIGNLLKKIKNKYIYFNWLNDKKLFSQLFILNFLKLIMAIVIIYIMPLSFIEKDDHAISIIDATSMILRNEYKIIMSFILLSMIGAFIMVNRFFKDIKKFGYNVEWKEHYTNEAVKSAKKQNIWIIIIAVCALFFYNSSY